MNNEVDPTLRAKYVTQAGQYDINLEANARFGDDNFYGLGGDLYLDKTFSVGAAYTGSDADGVDDDVFVKFVPNPSKTNPNAESPIFNTVLFNNVVPCSA